MILFRDWLSSFHFKRMFECTWYIKCELKVDRAKLGKGLAVAR